VTRIWIFAAALLGTSGAALAQAQTPAPAPAPALTIESPCPQPVADAAADARRNAIAEIVLTPTDPEEFQKAFAAAQSAAPPADQARIRELLARDWPNLCRYQEANAALQGGPRPRAVFMGDSITEGWVDGDPALFADGVVGRGIGGQTSPQMLVRFWPDVVALMPRVVHIMAGTNDIAGNTGPATMQDFRNNILAMSDLARANGIAVVLAGIPPSQRLYWRGELDPRPLIRDLNAWLRATAEQRGLVFVDYGVVLADAGGGLREDLGNDGVHPNRTGYAAMRPLAERAIAAALERSSESAR
jgi:lysophospholipase L1-like esterase